MKARAGAAELLLAQKVDDVGELKRVLARYRVAVRVDLGDRCLEKQSDGGGEVALRGLQALGDQNLGSRQASGPGGGNSPSGTNCVC